MSLQGYMQIKGLKQGDITQRANTPESVGDDAQKTRLDFLTVLAIDHEISVAFNPQNGTPLGRRTHGPYKVTCLTNRSKPLLLTALCTGEPLELVRLEHYRNNNGISDEHYYTTQLHNAKLVKIVTHQPHTHKSGQDQLPLPDQLELWFTYQKIVETHVTSNTEGSDDWNNA